MRTIFVVLLLGIVCSLSAQVDRIRGFSSRSLNSTERKSLNTVISDVNKNWYPYGTINMVDFYRSSVNRNAWNYAEGTLRMSPQLSKQSYVNMRYDTIQVVDTADRIIGYFYNSLVINSDLPTAPGYVLRTRDVLTINNLKGDTTENGTWLFPESSTLWLSPGSGDTILADMAKGFDINLQMSTTQSDSYVKVNNGIGVYVYASYDDYVRADSATGIYIWQRDIGIPNDSLNVVHGIYNDDGGLRGADRTYFLYSEYGDNYLNGDLEVTGAIKQAQLTGSLTDGAPTDSEIDTVIGTTPDAVGAGWAVTILDSDGTGLLYRVESDGTNWIYWTGAAAL